MDFMGNFPACHVSFSGVYTTIFYLFFRCERFVSGRVHFDGPRPKDGHVEILTPAGSTRAEVDSDLGLLLAAKAQGFHEIARPTFFGG